MSGIDTGPAEDATEEGEDTGDGGFGGVDGAGGGSPCIDSSDCADGYVCRDGECVPEALVDPPSGGGGGDGGDDTPDDPIEELYPCDVFTDFAPYDHAVLSDPNSFGCGFLDPDRDPSVAERINAFTYGFLEWGMGSEEFYQDGGPFYGIDPRATQAFDAADPPRSWGGYLDRTEKSWPLEDGVIMVAGAGTRKQRGGRLYPVGIFPVGLGGERSGPEQLRTDILIAISEQQGVVTMLLEGQSDYLLKVATGQLPGSEERTEYWQEAVEIAQDYLDDLERRVYEAFFDPTWSFTLRDNLYDVEEPVVAWYEARGNYITRATANDSLYWYGDEVLEGLEEPTEEDILGDTLVAAGINTADCDEEQLFTSTESTIDTCVEQESVFLPNWTTREVNDIFFDPRRCLYCAVVEATGDGATTDCSEEYLNSFIGEGVEKIKKFYDKVDFVEFYDSELSATEIGTEASLQEGSAGLTRQGLVFVGSARVDDYYMPPQPLIATRILVTVDAEEFNRIPENPVMRAVQTNPEIDLDTGEKFVVFDMGQFTDMIVKVSESMLAHEKTYSAWAYEQGAYIPNFDLIKEVKRLKSFEKELRLFVKENGYPISIVDKLEIRFNPDLSLKFIKVREKGCLPEELTKGLPGLKIRPPITMQQTMAFVWQLPIMNRDVMARNPMPWLEFYTKHYYPALPEVVYGPDPTAPTEEGGDGIDSAEGSCQTSVDFVPNEKFMKNAMNSLRDAIAAEFNKNPCLLVDGKILEDAEKDKIVSRIVDMSLKEYLASDRFIEELPEMFVRGQLDDLRQLYTHLLDQMGWCGWVELIKAVVDCILNALGYEDAITIVLKSALRGMDEDAFIEWLSELPPEIQDLIIGAVKDFYPQAMPLLQAIIQKTVDDIPPPPPIYPTSYSSKEGKNIALGAPPSTAERVGTVDTGYPNPGDFGSLKEAVVNLLDTQADLLIEPFLETLETFPGVGIAIAAIQKIDKFCPVPPLFSPPLKDFIKLPQLKTDICKLKIALTMPDFPKLKTADWSRLLWKNLMLILEELMIRLVIVILQTILRLIVEEICKDRSQDPADLRDILVSSLCEGGDISEEEANAAMTDIISTIGCIEATPDMVGRMIDNISAVITQCELLDLIQGKASPTALKIVRETISADPMTAPLAECFPDDESVLSFFAAMGAFMNLDVLCTVDAFELPIADSLCDDLGLLQTFSDTRAALLREKGVSEECIQDQLCSLRDRLGEELEALANFLQGQGDLSEFFPDILDDPEDPNQQGLLPYIDPIAADMASRIFTSLFGVMDFQFTQDLVGPDGFINMVLADSRGRGLTQHTNFERFLGPGLLNIYGSRGTRINPPRDEWKLIRNNDRAFWTIPYFLNPYGIAGGPADEEDTDAPDIVGQPPAVGGFPDKVAGHLQDEMDPEWGQQCLDKSFNKADTFAMVMKYNDYRSEDEETSDLYDFTVKYDWWAGDDVLDNRCRIRITDDRVYGSELTYRSADFIDQSTSDLITSLYNVSNPSHVWGQYITELWQDASETAGVGLTEDIRPHFESSVFNTINDGFFSRIVEKVSTNRKAFTFGYKGAIDTETGMPKDDALPKIVYFHQDSDLDLTLDQAVNEYGGTADNPPFYIQDPKYTGWLKLSQELVPEIHSCDDPTTTGSSLGNFIEIKNRCDELFKKVKDDDRFQLDSPKYKIIEEPFDRMLRGSQVAAIEGSINATIRVYLLEAMLKGLSTFSLFRPKFGDMYSDVFSSYVVEDMIESMIDIGRGKKYNVSFPRNRRYMLSFLEMAVQIYQKRIDIGEIQDETPLEKEARLFLFNKVRNEWEPPVFTGGSDPRSLIEAKKDNLYEFLDDDDVIANAKILLRRYVSDELERASEMFIEKTSPPLSNMVDVFFGNDNWIYESVPSGGPIHVSRDTNETNPYLREGGSDDALAGWPFVLEKYILVEDFAGSPDRDSKLKKVVNLDEFKTYISGLSDDEASAIFQNLSMGLRISYIPSATDLAETGIGGVSVNDAYANENKAFSVTTRYLTPLVSTEKPIDMSLTFREVIDEINSYQTNYLPDLICQIIEEPEYKMLFKYCFPLERILSVVTVFCLRAFLPSIGRGGPTRELVDAGELEYNGDYSYGERYGDGWFKEGGTKIGFKKGFRNWERTNVFKESKYSSKQIFKTALNVGNFDFVDEDLDAPGEDFARNSRVKSNEGMKIKWWMWRSLRPPPCKE